MGPPQWMILAFAAVLAPISVSTQASGDGAWATAYSKAATALAKLSNNDKVGIVTGLGWQQGPCVGNTKAVSSIGYPSLCLQDGPLGVRYKQQVTAFPAGIMAASTWDTGLMYSRGNALGSESKASGVNVQLGPVAGPLGKIPQGGRNWGGCDENHVRISANIDPLRGILTGSVPCWYCNVKHHSRDARRWSTGLCKALYRQ